MVLGLEKVGNNIGLDSLKLLYSWLKPERYSREDHNEIQAIRAAGYSQVNRSRSLLLHNIFEAACSRFGKDEWPDKSIRDLPDLGSFPLPLRLSSERDDVGLIDRQPFGGFKKVPTLYKDKAVKTALAKEGIIIEV